MTAVGTPTPPVRSPATMDRPRPLQCVLVTGSSGLIGSAAVAAFCRAGAAVTGIDNDGRADFFGPSASTAGNRRRLEREHAGFSHVTLDVRDRAGVDRLVREGRFDAVLHTAAQPSHDLAAVRPFDDFDVNAGGTLNLLEACRRHAPDAGFVLLSTNKVYGDGVNHLDLEETPTRIRYAEPAFAAGIDESFPVDRCLHSLFGCSKLAADVMTQEYGRNFGLPTAVLRGGCLTGPDHVAVEAHGFLAHLVRMAARGGAYTVFGHGGKQVRDQLHAADVVDAALRLFRSPRPGAVYNLGGGPANAASLLELVERIEALGGGRPTLTFDPTPRVGDHACWISDTRALQRDTGWRVTRGLDAILFEMIAAARLRPRVVTRTPARRAAPRPTG